MKPYLFILLGVSLFSTACGGGGIGATKTDPPAMYTISGTVSGLAGTGLVLQNNSGDNLPVSANATAFAFPTSVPSGTGYKVSVMTQPSSPTQTCAVSKGSGTVTGNVKTVNVVCTTMTYTISGSMTGLVGTGLVLQNNSGDNLPVSANATAFAFPTPVDSGKGYKVSVMTQPSSPTQNCVVSNGSGTATADVKTVNVACTTTTYTIGGSITGLVGTGLVLQNNSGDNLPVSVNATAFTFATPVDSGAGYKVSVLTQPSTPTQNCVVTGGNGTATGDVKTVNVACTTTPYTIGGSITGLAGTGLVLQNNSADNLPVNANATSFTFATAVASGSGFKVSVLTQPSSPAQNCVVTGGTGTANADVTTVAIACTTTKYTVGGSITGLVGTGLVLQNNNGDNLTVSANATTFTFATSIDGGSGYKVTVLTQPSSPTQSCSVTGGSGTASVNVTTVLVTCSNVNEWTWVNGPEAEDQSGIYGTEGIADTANVPGARYWGLSWTDANGNFWLFGGYGFDSAGNGADLGDLWEGNYNSGGQWTWTWVGGADIAGSRGIYGALGTADPANIPGARDSAVSWTDASGNFWLFGGHGYDVNRTADNLNDLWEYSTTTSEWKWVSGSDTVNQIGNYGTLGTGTTSTVPGARYSAVSWIDKQGNFWLFGGRYETAGVSYYLNDLWKGNYNSSNQWIWTWEGGSNSPGEKGTYGSVGVSNSANIPGARYLSTSWTDQQGNLWLFGGYGLDSVNTTSTAVLSDLWEYNTTTGQWTWVGGYETAAWRGIYGTLGVANSGNIPGSRKGSVAWADSQGNFWLFGGVGIDSTPPPNNAGQLNDLWQYNPTTSEWMWVSGSNTVNQLGNYVGPDYVPGSRGGSQPWIDSSGNLWLFGGNGPLSGVNGSFSDLWKYTP